MVDSHRREILDLFQNLHREKGITLLHITHSSKKRFSAQDLSTWEDGRVSFSGRPEEFL
jgi:ABC-type thiamine transport system ATPase subunit